MSSNSGGTSNPDAVIAGSKSATVGEKATTPAVRTSTNANAKVPVVAEQNVKEKADLNKQEARTSPVVSGNAAPMQEERAQNATSVTSSKSGKSPKTSTPSSAKSITQSQKPLSKTAEPAVKETVSETNQLPKSAPKSSEKNASVKRTKSIEKEQRSPPKDNGAVEQPDPGVSRETNLLRYLCMAQKSEWNSLDQILRGLKKADPSEINAKDADTGITTLMLAVRENRLVIAERLIELGASVNDPAADGWTSLHFAAAYAREDIVKLLLSRKADPMITAGPKEQLALHLACSRPGAQMLLMVQALLKAGSKDSRLIADKDGTIALFLAADTGNLAIAKELLNSHADPQIKQTRKDSGDTVLHTASRRKEYELAKLFVECGANVDAQNHEGLSPLHVSASEGDEVIVKFLYQNKANANIIDKLDRSPLHIAAERGHTAIVDLLVDKCHANISARTKDGSTLIHIASQYGHPDTALAFLKKGVLLQMPNKAGAICLHTAAACGHVSVLKALLQKGAPVDVRSKDQYTPLHVGVENCKPLAVQTLLGMGAQVELKGGKVKETALHIASRVKDGEKCAEMLLKSGADVNAPQENGETSLHIAARYGQLKMVQALLSEGGDPMWQSKTGETALHVSVRYCHCEVATELLEFVTKTKSYYDATILVNLQNMEGETALHLAAEVVKKHAHHEFEDTDLMKLLLNYEGDIDVKTKLTQETPMHYCARAGNVDVLLEMVKHIEPNKIQNVVNKQARNGWSPLLVASEVGHLEILKILLKNHARVDVFDEHGNAALHLAAERGHEDVANMLLLNKAFVNAKSKLGVTPLHVAAQNGYNQLVKLLIEKHGASKDALSLAKRTPLHMSAQNGQIEVCSALLKMKADANAKDVQGQTPLHLAAENDHSDVVKLFLKYRPELVTMGSANGMTCAHIAASKGSVAVSRELMRFNKMVVITARNKTNESTSLHLAASGGHAEVVRYLLEAGASATDENADGLAAIHLASRYGHIQVLEALRGKVSWKATSTKTGLTALHVAAQHGQMELVREMLTQVPATVRSEAPHGTADARDTEYGLTPLHLAAQSGHEGVVRLLLNSPGVQSDAVSFVNGVTPLHLAAQNGHTAVVSLLLSKSTGQLHMKCSRGRSGLLLAAANGHRDMVALLLGQGADINGYDKNGWTPLHFAAKSGHLDVVQMLMEGGAQPTHETKDGKVAVSIAAAASHTDVLSYLLHKEHDTHQLMENSKFVFDLMLVSKTNSNRSMREFVLVSSAPLETSVKLSKQLRVLAIREKERARDLLLAADFCETMAMELTAVAAAANSAGALLKAVDHHSVPILDMLIDCEQKQVMSHAAVQKYLSEVWTGQLSHWSGWRMLVLFVALLFLPPVWLAFSLPLRHRYNKVPIIKFMSYLISHIYLIVLFVLTIVYPLVPIWESADLIPHWHEWLLLAWLSGLVVSQLTNPEDRAGLGWIKIIIIVMCSIAVSVHLVAFAFDTPNRLLLLYIRNQFFGVSLMLCFIQLLDFLSFHHLFGPWAIIIRNLMSDLIRFLVILSIFMFGFTFQLATIYRPVTGPVALDADKGTGDGAGGSPVESPFDTFEMLFFALFGLIEPENLPPVHRNPSWTITLVKAVFGVYLIITLIVLINLLIAMMSDTYQRIQAQSDIEWKFGRAKLFRNMNRTSATPSPMNLLTKLFTYCKVLFKYRGKVCSMEAQRYVDAEEDLDDHGDTQSVDMNIAVTGSTGSHWLHGGRRNIQVGPEDGYHRPSKTHSTVKIEDVVDWKQVIVKYMVLQGLAENPDPNDSDRLDDVPTSEVQEINETKTS